MAKRKTYYDVTDGTFSDFLSRMLGGGHTWFDEKTYRDLKRRDPRIRVIATKRYGESPLGRRKPSR